ncbi:MAG: hypothetical protein OEY67_00335 [Gammaproteobacteria bacterium]|nr:hypothetical protein [Gammaproteobacteria bacterium]
MALRLRTTWHQTKRVRRGKANITREKTVEDRAGVIGFNIWKVAQQVIRHMMEEEHFSFASDKQLFGVLTELIAFLIQVVDRMVYGQVTEEDRAKLINAAALHLAKTMENNQTDVFGEGDYIKPFIDIINQRAQEYAQCSHDAQGPGYAFCRTVADHVADIMAEADNKWVLEWVMDIEVPEALKQVKRLVASAMGIKPEFKVD